MIFPKHDFEKTSCKDANVEKGMLVDLFDKINDDAINVHSLMLIKDGAKVFDAYAYEQTPETHDNVFSVSKSFTSLAIGMLIDRKLLSVTDLIWPFFKEEVPNPSDHYKKLTVQHLLTMSAGQARDYSDLANEQTNPIEVFFSGDVQHEPGTHFMYNNLCSFILSAIVTKITHENLNDFLDHELYQPLGIEKPIWKNWGPYAFGASGLRLTLNDMGRFGLLLLNEGMWESKQIVSAEYIKEATSYHISTNNCDKEQDRFGYGYQFWINDFGDYRCSGLFNQQIIINRRFNSVFVFKAYTEDPLLGLFSNYVLPAMEKGWLYDNFTLRHYTQRFHDASKTLIEQEKETRTLY